MSHAARAAARAPAGVAGERDAGRGEAADWTDANQRDLVRALERVRLLLTRHAAGEAATGDAAASAAVGTPGPSGPEPEAAPNEELALATLVRVFGLSPFERDIVALCAGVELDARFAPLVASAHGDAARRVPTFGLALAAFPNAHWSALTPGAPLRAWRLVEVMGPGLTTAGLRLDERILHFLAGVNQLDERLQGVVELIQPRETERTVRDGDRAAVAHRVAVHLDGDPAARPAVHAAQITGADAETRLAIAASASAELGATALRMRAAELPAGAAERFALTRLVARDALLGEALLVMDAAPEADGGRVSDFLDEFPAPVIVSADDPVQAIAGKAVVFEVPAATREERMALWDPSRVVVRPRMEGLAQRIDAIAGWEDLVLPEPQLRLLRDITAHVRERHRVYEEWGFAEKSARGLGITALYSGAPGTGKTMAAEVLARELRLDLYRIDLASVVSKYIGETEKNLKRLFDAAEGSGAILLFDEADALFGKRSEVKDSHDRYANIEVSYLLQRMEGYRGLAILTTNMKSALDPAFLRRIRFVVQFPFPDTEQRAAIWRGIFPARTPTAELDYGRLARLDVAGGNIRNIALGAAFLAANRDEKVTMRHVADAARAEYAKLERVPTDTEMRGWV